MQERKTVQSKNGHVLLDGTTTVTIWVNGNVSVGVKCMCVYVDCVGGEFHSRGKVWQICLNIYTR